MTQIEVAIWGLIVSQIGVILMVRALNAKIDRLHRLQVDQSIRWSVQAAGVHGGSKWYGESKSGPVDDDMSAAKERAVERLRAIDPTNRHANGVLEPFDPNKHGGVFSPNMAEPMSWKNEGEPVPAVLFERAKQFLDAVTDGHERKQGSVSHTSRACTAASALASRP